MGVLSTLLLLATFGAQPSDVVILSFHVPGCRACEGMRQSLAPVEERGVLVRRLDATAEKQAVESWRVDKVPTLIIVQDGREIDRVEGFQTPAFLSDRLSRLGVIGTQDNATREQVRPSPGSLDMQASGPTIRGQSPDSPQPFPFLGNSSSNSDPTGRSITDGRPGSLPTPSAPATLSLSDRVPSNAPREFDRPIQLGALPGRSASQASVQTASGEMERNRFDDSVRSAESLSEPSMTPAESKRRAIASTVRLRIEDPQTQSNGSGTIIDQQGNAVLVLTCGHLFRDLRPDAEIWIDRFINGQTQSIRGQLVSFQADKQDIGFVTFNTDQPVETAPVLPLNSPLQVGQPAFSVGCDKGNEPSLRDTQVTHLNRYLHSDNVEIAGAPVDGRSGGGLFDSQGRLIGICNAANHPENEGIYAGPNMVHEHLQKLQLARLITPSSPAVRTASVQSSIGDIPPQSPRDLAASTVTQASTVAPISPKTPSQAVVIILKSPNGEERKVTIDQPAPELIRWIEQNANGR